MKLVDLLIKHNVQWPVGATSVWQGQSLTLYWGRANRHAFITTNLPELSDREDHSYRCTKAEYDAARLKWVRNRGRKDVCPCDTTRDIEVRFRNKTTNANLKGGTWMWKHYNSSHDIMAWRYV